MRHRLPTAATAMILLTALFCPHCAAAESTVPNLAPTVTRTGMMEQVFLDDFERIRSETHVHLVGHDGRRQRLRFHDNQVPDAGASIKVSGVQNPDGSLTVSRWTLLDPPPEERGGFTTGEQRVVVLLVNSYENPVEPATLEEMAWLVFDGANPWSVESYFREVSYGKAWLTGDVFGWYTLPLTEDQLCNDYQAVLAAAVEAADPDVYYPDYFRLMILFPENGCPWGGLGNSGLVWFATDDGDTQMSWSLYHSVAQFGGTESYGGSSYHELGHNLGLGHANDWECGERTTNGDCESINYGDVFDTMGMAGAKGHYSAIHKEEAGWFDPGHLAVVDGPGTWVLEPLETDAPGLKALRIPTPAGRAYYVEFRQPIGFDTNVAETWPADFDGAQIRLAHQEENGDAQLLDTTPHYNSSSSAQHIDSLLAVLNEGAVFVDTVNQLTITTIDVSEEQVMVHVAFTVPWIIAGPGPDLDNPPLVRLYPAHQDALVEHEFQAYGTPSRGVNTAAGRPGDGSAPLVITGPGPGEIYGPHVRGFSLDGTPLAALSFLAYGTNRWGVNVTAGDLDGDGTDEIITGAGPGMVFGPHVRSFSWNGAVVIPVPGVSFFAYGTPRWGVNVAAGDVDGDGIDEIVTGAGPGAIYGPHVRGWNVDGGAVAAIPGMSWMAYATARMGVKVACSDLDGDGIDEIITAPGPSPSYGAHIRGWDYDGESLRPLAGFSFVPWSGVRYGASIAAGFDLDGDGREELLAGAGPDPGAGSPVMVCRYDGSMVHEWFTIDAFPAGWTHGTTLAAITETPSP